MKPYDFFGFWRAFCLRFNRENLIFDIDITAFPSATALIDSIIY